MQHPQRQMLPRLTSEKVHMPDACLPMLGAASAEGEFYWTISASTQGLRIKHIQTSIIGILKGCSLFFICYLSSTGQATGTPTTMHIEGCGEVELIGAKWNEPLDNAKVRRCMETMEVWYKEKLFDPFRVAVSPVHPLVKSIKEKWPVLVLRFESEPDVVFWVTLEDNGKKILIETPATGGLRLVAPPKGQTIDLGFAKPPN